MKKIFTSVICLGAALVASAQNFVVTGAGDVTYNDGDVINVGYTAGARPGTYVWDPALSVSVVTAVSPLMGGQSTFTVTATADTPSIVQFCGLDGQCTMLSETALTKRQTYGVGDNFSLSLDIASRREIIAAPIKVTLQISDSQQTVNLTINFLTSEQAGISAPEALEPALTISGRTLNYNVDSRTNLTLYNISGRAVLNRNVDNSGTISLDALPAGVYVYRLGEETGKILVR